METLNNAPEKIFSIMNDCIYSSENPGYNDAKIKKSISIALSWYMDAPMESLGVTVKNGFVSLYGIVLSLDQKTAITDIVLKTKGVYGIKNNICAINELLQN
jgi:osmotically-inducible protein OsmY